jgi:hypothetical protein
MPGKTGQILARFAGTRFEVLFFDRVSMGTEGSSTDLFDLHGGLRAPATHPTASHPGRRKVPKKVMHLTTPAGSGLPDKVKSAGIATLLPRP